MKKIAAISILVVTSAIYLPAQKLEKFFDSRWKECGADKARFYAQIVHTDSGWARRDYFLPSQKEQMQGLYQDSACTIKNGSFYYFHANGNLELTGKYENDKKTGLWLRFHPNGFLKDSTVYDNCKPTGTSLQWHNNGYLSDSTVYNEDGAVAVCWFDNGSLSSAGRLSIKNQYNGKWQFFHRNGQLSAEEVYANGTLVSRKYFAEDGTAVADTANKDQPAVFPGGIEAWIRYLDRNLYWPSNYKIVNGDRADVGVDFTADETGKVKDINISIPFHSVFNDIVEKVIKKSPKWIPSISHNRTVAYHHRQTVNFVQKTD